jgi:hypothetical protein
MVDVFSKEKRSFVMRQVKSSRNKSTELKLIAFFICVADKKIPGHQLKSKILGQFPSDYTINEKVIEKQNESRTSDFDERFLKKFKELKMTIKANIIFERKISAKKINMETKLIVWEILTSTVM